MGDEKNEDAACQMYDLWDNALLDQIKPIGVWLKFTSVPFKDFDPPIPFTSEAIMLHVEALKTVERARAAAAAEE